MLQNYLHIALRNIFRNKLTAFINISGLALAMASALMIYLFINDELQYDKYNSKADRVYRVTRAFLDNNGAVNLHLGHVAPPIGPLLTGDFAEMESMARTLQYPLVMAIEENGERKKIATQQQVYMAEPAIFDILDFEIVKGNPATALTNPLTIMLSETSALKYFETVECIGKRMKAGRILDVEVTGVFKDFALQSHWHPQFLISFSTLYDDRVYGRNGLDVNWGDNSFTTYVALIPGADPVKIESRFPKFIDARYGSFAIANENAGANFVASRTTTLHLQKLTDIHLRSHLDSEIEVNGDINNVYMMGVIAAFIILIACFNFINLSTARATKRAKEVGLRKVAGAFRQQLIFQFLGESMLVAFFGLVLAMGTAYTFLPWLNEFTGKALLIDLVANWPLTLVGTGITLLVGILAGIYPAFVISAFRPVTVLKGLHGSVSGKPVIRKALVVSQFAISIVLIIATAVTIEQLGYINSRDLGFNKDRVVTLPFYFEMVQNYESFYNEITKSSNIKNATRSSRLPSDRLLDAMGTGGIMRGDSIVDTGIVLKFVGVDHEFFDTYGVSMMAGRSFSKSVVTDDSLGFVINEAAALAMGWKTSEECVDEALQYGGVTGKIIGVVKDFHFESLHQEITPMIFMINRFYYNYITVKIAGNNTQAGIEHLQKVWKDFLPIRPFDYQFTSDQYARLYSAEEKQGQLFTLFSGLAILIACLGLFGLATFNTLQRTKEIGIRKVLGASISGILVLLSREVVILIVVANLIAWPIAWYLMDLWLGNFAYHITMNVTVCLLAAFAAIVIALFTVSFQTVRAAKTNPAVTLKYE